MRERRRWRTGLTELLFPTPRGLLWRERNFYCDVWYPAQERSGVDVRPHETAARRAVAEPIA